jgi:hypothetical protein
MKILPAQPVPVLPAASPSSPAPELPSRSNLRRAPTPTTREVVAPAPNVTPIGGQQPDITFHRDSNGRVYYVVSDAQSGKEIQELPTQAVRNVGDSIDKYLRQQEAKAASHVNVKA